MRIVVGDQDGRLLAWADLDGSKWIVDGNYFKNGSTIIAKTVVAGTMAHVSIIDNYGRLLKANGDIVERKRIGLYDMVTFRPNHISISFTEMLDAQKLPAPPKNRIAAALTRLIGA